MAETPKKKNDLAVFTSPQVDKQGRLFAVTEVEVDGVGMGILSDGTPYLTLGGLSRVCGVAASSLREFTNNWEVEMSKPRGVKIRELLALQGHDGVTLKLKAFKHNTETHAYTDAVCMALLEYYAFEASLGKNETALNNYRLLARSSLRQFIYNRCGYDPNNLIPESWRNYHERVLLSDQIPANYFSVFREVADLVVHMIQGGCIFDDHTVPDISVGQAWGSQWTSLDLGGRYGDRVQHPHFYPDWYPQSASNPQPAWIYPVTALGEFRIWLYSTYIPLKFPKYIESKVKKGTFLPSRAELMLDAVAHKVLTDES